MEKIIGSLNDSYIPEYPTKSDVCVPAILLYFRSFLSTLREYVRKVFSAENRMNFKKKLRKFNNFVFGEIHYGPSSMSIDLEDIEEDEGVKEMSKKIQDLWHSEVKRRRLAEKEKKKIESK